MATLWSTMTRRPAPAGRPLRVLFLSWRDQWHPEAGGAEAFLDHVSSHLAALGHEVTVLTARYDGSRADETVDGRRFLRRGGRFTVYPWSLLRLLLRRRSVDVVIDVQNGIPFWSPLVTAKPVVNLVHHVHREQWPEVFGPARARFGWWLESRVAPRVYARSHYLVVSAATRDELATLGVDASRTAVVYSGRDPAPAGEHAVTSDEPTLVVLGRLVPHKRVELAIEALAALRRRHPELTLHVVGHGYWHDELVARASTLGVTDAVTFHGFVDDATKNALLGSAWVNLLPSLKEGWGLAIIEAGAQGVPSIAFREASGTTESVLDGLTGFLVEDPAEFETAIERVLLDPVLRKELGEAAREFAENFTWEATAAAVELVLRRAVGSVVAFVPRQLDGHAEGTGPDKMAAPVTDVTRPD
ncbi:MAG: glycosyltransferase family 4 protein [Actinomycetes bacterium]